jgi:hypothetical protein
VNDLAHDEKVLLKSARDVRLHGHGQLVVEIRDGKIQMIHKTEKIKLS